MSEVVGLRGMTPPGEPVPDVVAVAEELLARARSGEVRALVLGTIHGDGGVQSSWAWSPGSASEPIVAAAAALDYRVRRELLGG